MIKISHIAIIRPLRINKTTIFIMMVLFLSKINAQVITGQTIIPWYNGNVTMLQDLGKVYINMKNGQTIKKARLWEIHPQKIVYEKDGCLHDLSISDILNVSPGGNCRSILYFDKQNKPAIKENESRLFGIEEMSDFKVSYKVSEMPYQKPIENENKNLQPNDTVVKADGQIVIAKIITLTESEIKYKRADLPDGPTYNLNTGPETEVIKHAGSVKVILKK